MPVQHAGDDVLQRLLLQSSVHCQGIFDAERASVLTTSITATIPSHDICKSLVIGAIQPLLRNTSICR